VSSESVRLALDGAGARGLVGVYDHPSAATLAVRVPLERHLVAGTEYELLLKSEDYAETTVYSGEAKTFLRMERDGKVFSLRVRAERGPLTVAGRKSKGDPKFSYVLGYVVE